MYVSVRKSSAVLSETQSGKNPNSVAHATYRVASVRFRTEQNIAKVYCLVDFPATGG